MSIVAVMPTHRRTNQAVALILRMRETAPDLKVWAIESQGDDLDASLRNAGCDDVTVVTLPAWATAVQKWNVGARDAVAALAPDHLMLAADDIWPVEPRWCEHAQRELARDGVHVVAFNDLEYDGAHLGTHYVASVEFCVRVLGGVFVVPHYRSWGIDEEMTRVAQRAGAYAWARDAVVEHRHPHSGKAAMDATYSHAWGNHFYDSQIFELRKARNFPIDYARCL